MSTSVIFEPTIKHLKEIEIWLSEEYKITGSGFYSNWNIIKKSFIENRIVIITENDISIGFVIYEIYNLISYINILEVKPSHRNKGIGKKIVIELLNYLKNQGCLVSSLFCMPESSEGFWKSIGFIDTPDLRFNNNKKYLFKSIIDTLKHSKKNSNDGIIELWNLEPYKTKDTKSKWQWIIKYKNNSSILEKPIIFPADSDWQIRWKK